MKKRGRPRKFDEQAVNKAMMGLFWKQGYAATSLDELTEVTGVNRPSLYSAFGSKLDIYLRCIDLQAQRLGKLREYAVHENDSLERVLQDYFEQLIEYYFRGQDSDHGLGCPIFSSAVSEAPNNERIQLAVENTLQVVEAEIENIITNFVTNQSQDEIEATVDMAVSIFLSLGIRVRSGKPKSEVKRAAFNSIKGVIASLNVRPDHN